MGSFGQKRKNIFFRFCRPILDIFGFTLLNGFGGRCLNIREVCMDFEPCFKVSVYPKGMKLGQMTNLNVILHVVVSVCRLVTIWNSPQFLVEFRNGLYEAYTRNLWQMKRALPKRHRGILFDRRLGIHTSCYNWKRPQAAFELGKPVLH